MGKFMLEHQNKPKVIELLQDGHYFYHKGLKAYRERNLTRASKLLQRAIVLEPENASMLYQLAVIYTEMGHYQQSNELLSYILNHLKDDMAECHFFMANNYAYLGLFHEAYKSATKYSAAEPDGDLCEENESLLELLEMSDEDLSDPHNQDDLLVNQDEARSLLEEGMLDEAIQILEKIIKEYPEFWSAYNNLALAHFYAGNVDKAKQTLQTVLKGNSGNLHALCNLLVFYYYEHDDEKMLALSDRLSNVCPLLIEQQYKLGATFSLIGRFDLGFKWLKKLYKTGFEGDDTFYYWLSCSAYRTGRLKFAKMIWKRMKEEFPEDSRIEPWKSESEKPPVYRKTEERVAALFFSFYTNRTNEIQRYLQSDRVKTPFETQVGELLIHGEQPEMKVSDDALFAFRMVKSVHHADGEAGQEDVFCLFMAHVIQLIRGANLSMRTPRGWAAAVYYSWKCAQDQKVAKKHVADAFQISAATLTKYVNLVDSLL
ncbi:tetratricopeptide repeat protein [Bacillus capparidis]|uniref:Tetratricopeptide (TPR) repeat protein n=1 Tax=Bacillus capparidis TaxID=1840411 RepID=A0ABS4CW00_9BACI|nr:tetratricopeptide repeat protein [Bacillus capparidis]MBP1081298.1 tetratricopeptide (TPR) repeat protein [Bacillus capparidis]MED1095977.1 tetratricopeptide repeat protein [Bacillus capparidis]